MIVRHRQTIAAAHRLPALPPDHKCSRLHGHNWTITIEIEGPLEPTIGWVIDFGMLKAALSAVLDPLDHSYLNDFMPQPTCEGFAQYVADRINATGLVNVSGRTLRAVIVSEGGSSEVELRPENNGARK